MSIKDNIKEELLKRINDELDIVEKRMQLNNIMHMSNFDALAEQIFLENLKQFAESI